MIAAICKRPIASFAMFASIVAFGLVLVRPGSAACAILPALPLERLADGTLVDRSLSPVDRRRVVADHAAALGRIERTFGPARARPVIVQLATPDALWPLRYNSFGSTDFLPGRACIVLGPDGRNVDVLAHEMVHAEIADRVGFVRRWIQIPVWFDEGVAMQVDRRGAFDRPSDTAAVAMGAIRAKDSAARFFDADPDRLTENYAQAKREAARWLDRVGRRRLYDRLSQIANGTSFSTVWAE